MRLSRLAFVSFLLVCLLGGPPARAAALQVPEQMDAGTSTIDSDATILDTDLQIWLNNRFGHEHWLLDQAFILENWQWIGILVLIMVGVLVERLVSLLLSIIFRRFGKSERITLDVKRLRGFERPFGLLVMAWMFTTTLPLLSLKTVNETAFNVLMIAASFVLTISFVWSALRFVDLVCDFLKAKARHTDNKFDDMLVPLLRRTLKIIVVVIGIVYIASKVTDDLYGILAGLSIGSLAVGFAAKDSIENLFGTFTVLLDKPFELGDWITVGDVDGNVEHVGIRSTRVRTFYNSIITIPNSHFISVHVDNWGARRYRRIKTTLALTYDTPPEKIEAFCEGVRTLIIEHPYSRKDYYHVYLKDMGAASLDVLLYCFIEAPDWATELRERHRLLLDILRLAARLEVEFAFPTQTLHIPKDAPEHANRPAGDGAAASLGRKLAREVTSETLAPYGGNKPKAVKVGRNEALAPVEDDG